jgi:hypothetical protein
LWVGSCFRTPLSPQAGGLFSRKRRLAKRRHLSAVAARTVEPAWSFLPRGTPSSGSINGTAGFVEGATAELLDRRFAGDPQDE